MQQKETVALLRRIPGAELVIFGGRLYAILSLQITLRAALRFSLSTWQAQVLGRSRNGGLGSYEAGLAFLQQLRITLHGVPDKIVARTWETLFSFYAR